MVYNGGCVGAGGPRGASPRSRSGGVVGEEIPLFQGKEQWLRFAGAAVKPSGHGLLFAGRFLITVSISML